MREIYKNKNLKFTIIDETNGFVNLKFFNEAVMIIGIDENEELLVIQQKRLGSKVTSVEFPSGGIKKGETKLAAAKRELNEETGYDGKLQFIGSVQPLLGLVDLTLNIFLATNLKLAKIKMNPEDYEKITYSFLSVNEIKKIIKSSKKVNDGYLAIGLAYFLSSY